jgi:hypothetical protein
VEQGAQQGPEMAGQAREQQQQAQPILAVVQVVFG